MTRNYLVLLFAFCSVLFSLGCQEQTMPAEKPEVVLVEEKAEAALKSDKGAAIITFENK